MNMNNKKNDQYQINEGHILISPALAGPSQMACDVMMLKRMHNALNKPSLIELYFNLFCELLTLSYMYKLAELTLWKTAIIS